MAAQKAADRTLWQKGKNMFNDIVIGSITIHMYGVMIAAGFLAALLMTLRRGKKRGYDEDLIWGIFFCAIIGGMLGTRILYYIVEIPEILKDPSILWDFKNGYVVYGGIIGGILAALAGRMKEIEGGEEDEASKY